MRLIRSLHFETVARLGRRWPSYRASLEARCRQVSQAKLSDSNLFQVPSDTRF